MYDMFTCIYHKDQPNVGRNTIHGSYQIYNKGRVINPQKQTGTMEVCLGISDVFWPKSET